MTRPLLVPEPHRAPSLPADSGQDTLARAIWAHGHGRGVRAMEALAAMALNARHGQPGRSLVQVVRDPMLFAAWGPDDPRHGPMLAVDGGDLSFAAAHRIARRAIAGLDLIVAGANRFLDDADPVPAWAVGLTPVAVLAGFSFYRV
ncbi:hypothetical protein CHU95_03130 [Niveispirillum lacus]|uniref:Cell wall hydrolase SleB domain-containing protein n=1 Tax=Niveispirillum lacus TaxID=1981099 RepID=A0A255Z633_9PROT|nr:hypothetical protein [Niveispirillum lacus]OYQ36993.1 hypothetical protein CHU95_03130 [Niveispirillum lacus]